MTAPADDPRSLLNDHDRQLLALLAAGYDRREIGVALGVCPRTVRYHLERLQRKFQSANTRELLGRFIPQSTFGDPRLHDATRPPAISASSAARPASRRVNHGKIEILFPQQS